MDELDELEARVAGAARRRRRIVWSVVGVVVVLGLTPCAIVTWNLGAAMQESAERREEHSHRATPEQIAAVDEATRAFEGTIAARAAAWRSAMAGASTLVPRPDLGPCPTRLPMRQPSSAERGFSFDNTESYDAIVFPGGQAFPHAVTRGELPSEPPRAASARERAAALRERIRREGSMEDLAAIVTEARQLASQFWTYDVVVFASRHERPSVDATGTAFSSGYLEGVAVLYDYASDRPLCAGAVTAQNTSQDVQYTAQILDQGSRLQSMLDLELHAEIERAVARGVRYLAGAPVAPDVAPE